MCDSYCIFVYVNFIGFVYVGTFYHQFIHLTEYIAPLQADFNPGLNETATVLVHGTGMHVEDIVNDVIDHKYACM